MYIKPTNRPGHDSNTLLAKVSQDINDCFDNCFRINP